MNCCPTCGQMLPLPATTVAFSPLQQRLYDLVRKSGANGITMAALFERIYTNSDGGPDSGTQVLHTMVNHINHRLRRARQKQRIKATHRGLGAHYVLMPHEPVRRDGRCPLDPALVEQIRREYATHRVTQAQLAERYKISQPTVSMLVRRKTYKTVEPKRDAKWPV